MNRESATTAKAAGFHMPAEWERHDRCWMAWPYRAELWRDNLPATQQAYANVANAIAEFEPVTMLAQPGEAQGARTLCSDKVTIFPMDIDDSWTRDNGPNFVVNGNGELAASLFRFNAS